MIKRSLENFFTFNDFKSLEISAHGADNCAHIANALLREWLIENQPRVKYHKHKWGPNNSEVICFAESSDGYMGCAKKHTHKAILINEALI